MAALYYILAGSTLTELGAVGGTVPVIQRRTGAVSQATWSCDTDFDADPLWPHGTSVSVVRRVDGGANEILFSGRIFSPQGDGSGESESIQYTALDAWDDFDQEIYQQSRSIVSNQGVLSSVAYGRILLGQSDDGETRLTVAQICQAVANYAVSIGIGVQVGSFDAPVTPPWDEVRDKTLSEIILRSLKWQPDAVAWLDHSTVPPTFNVTRRANMSAQSFAVTSLDVCRIRSYPELKIPGCVITFEYSNARGRTVDTQTAGNALALRCARMTIPLEFESGSPGPEQEIAVKSLGDYNTVAWWQQFVPWLPSNAILSDVIATPVIPEGYVNYITAGVIQDWMRTEKLVDAVEVSFSAKAECTVDGIEYSEKDLAVTLTITNAVTKRYIGKFTPPYSESAPSTLAADFYAASSVLQYGGRIKIVEDECISARSLIGKKLNVTGSKTAWQTMGAVVVGVTENLDSGSSEVELGPQQHLCPQDMVELIRANRIRTKFSPLSRMDAGVKSDSTPAKAASSQKSDASVAPGKMTRIQMSDVVQGS
mgnify:CR=1 FL=1